MFTERFLRNRRGVCLDVEERARLEESITEIKTLPPRTNIVLAGDRLNQSILLLEGFMSRYIDDHNGLRQLVAVHVPVTSSISMPSRSRCSITTSQR